MQQKSVLAYLDATAARLPDKTAYTDEWRAVSFREVQAQAMAIGSAIAAATECTNGPVAVMVDRSADCPIAFLGALYSGNYYVPLDREMPSQRMKKILDSLAPLLILGKEADFPALQELAGDIPVLNMETSARHPLDPARLQARRQQVVSTDPVYVMFSSGSTGQPKGIVISHHGVIDLIEWMAEEFSFSEDDSMANQAPFHFDASVQDIYLGLKCGATVHILPRKLFMFPKLLIEYINEKQATTLMWATSAFHLVAASGILEKSVPQTVKRILPGGESLLARHLNTWRRALPQVTICNLYGPTEITVNCTFYKIERAFSDGDVIPIGYACPNMEILLLDEQRRPAPDGTPGELYVRGLGVGHGYYHDPERTTAAFVQNPLHDRYPDPVYKTGDIVKRNAWGELEFLARADDQIKHQGYRIELGEIERAVCSMPGITAAVCMHDARRDHILCVYEGAAEDVALIKHLRTLLPKYMIPNKLFGVAAMPYNANRKIDRVRLKEQYLT